jgi:hypothetical protein
MQTYTLLFIFAVVSAIVIGAIAAFRLTRSPKLNLPGGSLPTQNKPSKTTTPKGSLKISNVLSVFPDGTIRTRDGGYIRGFKFTPSETIYADAGDVAKLYDRFALMITSDLPKDSVIQFRLENTIDAGNLINDQLLQVQGLENCDPIAQMLKIEEISYYSELAAEDKFRTGSFYAWLYIPTARNGRSLNAFTSAFSALITGDFTGFLNAFHGNHKEVIARAVTDEEKSYRLAEKHFRSFEQNFPLRVTPLTHGETCVYLYQSHNPNAASMPIPPINIDTDWQGFLSRTPLLHDKDASWYLIHGRTPYTVVSLFEPMESTSESQSCFPGLMRFLTINPNLRKNCTIITEFIALDKDQTLKEINRELRRLKQTNTRPSGNVEFKDEKVKRSYTEREQIRAELSTPGKALTSMRFRIVIRGEDILTREDKKRCIKDLENTANDIVKIINQNMQGAQAGIEDPMAIREIFERSLIGELSPKTQHREIREQASSLSCFIPAESIWRGMKNDPHNIFVNTAGELLSVNLLRNEHSSSPLTVITGVSGSGKSVLAGELITGFLGSVENSYVRACDYGGSLAPLVNLFDGRHFTFSAKDPRTINIWDYPGIENRDVVSDDQISLVVKDTLILLGSDERSEQGKDFSSILEKCIRQVYKDEVPLNQPGRRHEPQLSHLLLKLRRYNFESPGEKALADKIASRLDKFKGNPWVDAPTHESYRQYSRIDVFELSSLDKLQDQLRSCLAFRIGARVSAGGEDITNVNAPTMVVFDEVHEYVANEFLSYTLRGAESPTRHGRKKNKIPVLITHSFADIQDFPGFTSNLGTIFVGRQDNIDALKNLKKINGTVEAAISSIDNVKGMAHQFMMITGQGDTHKVATIQVYLPPIGLWTLTTDPPESEARELVKKAFPHWPFAKVLVFLARKYPRGLSFAGKKRIEDQVLYEEILLEAANDPKYREYLREISSQGLGLLTVPDEIELGEIADELIELADTTITDIQRSNFEPISDKTVLEDLELDIPGLVIHDVQEPEQTRR